MEEKGTRVAMIGIIVESGSNVAELNALLHDARQYIIGRMGIPYPQKGINVISVALDAPQDLVNTLSGKLGRLSGISTKTIYAPETK